MKIIQYLFVLVLLVSCSKEDSNPSTSDSSTTSSAITSDSSSSVSQNNSSNSDSTNSQDSIPYNWSSYLDCEEVDYSNYGKTAEPDSNYVSNHLIGIWSNFRCIDGKNKHVTTDNGPMMDLTFYDNGEFRFTEDYYGGFCGTGLYRLQGIWTDDDSTLTWNIYDHTYYIYQYEDNDTFNLEQSIKYSFNGDTLILANDIIPGGYIELVRK